MSADRFSTRKLIAFSGSKVNFLYFEMCCILTSENITTGSVSRHFFVRLLHNFVYE